MNTKVLILAAVIGGSSHAAVPCHTLQCMPDAEEHHEVSGSRIPGYLFVTEQSEEFKQLGGGAGGSSASPAEVNESGTKKAEKAKENDQPWFISAANSATAFVKSLTGISWDFTGGFSRTTDKNGNTVDKLDWCLSWAKGSHNKDTCSKVDATKRPDGKFVIEIKKLLAQQDGQSRWRLVYSTTDTLTFVVDDPEEVVSIFHSIDPAL